MGASACVIIIRKGRIAVIRSRKHGGAFELPGGKAEPGEDQRSNARRECREEVGVDPILVMELLCQMDVGGYLCSTFLGVISDDVELTSGLEGEATWVTPEEMLTGTYKEHSAQWLELPVIQQILGGNHE